MEWLSDIKDLLTDFFSKPPEALVLGAELRCPYGSKHTFLMVETDHIDINNLPKACVDDCKKSLNIEPFGQCYGGSPCEEDMELESKWENPEPQNELINGKEIITTKSVLLCKARGMEIQAVTSGQEGVMAARWALYAEIEKQFPGLLAILLDPYGSLYLNEGMYEIAITFLLDRIVKNGGEIFLPSIYGKDDPEGELIRAALERLLPDCDASACDRLINGLENTGYLTGMDEVKGWDVNSLNLQMIVMLRKDCAATDKKIKTDPFARLTEENKVFTSSMSSAMTQIAYGAIMFQAMQAKPVEKTGENPFGKMKEKPKEITNSGRVNSFADLMSPEDAERYLRFLENGSTAGLTPEELAGIQKVDDYLLANSSAYSKVMELRSIERSLANERAFNYYKDLAGRLDVSTAPNTAVFYSGPGNRDLAEAFADMNKKVTLEKTTGGKFLDDADLFNSETSPLTRSQAREVWSIVSERYAQQASGNTYGFVSGAKPDSIFNSYEYPALQNNSNVTNVFTELLQGGL